MRERDLMAASFSSTQGFATGRTRLGRAAALIAHPGGAASGPTHIARHRLAIEQARTIRARSGTDRTGARRSAREHYRRHYDVRSSLIADRRAPGRSTASRQPRFLRFHARELKTLGAKDGCAVRQPTAYYARRVRPLPKSCMSNARRPKAGDHRPLSDTKHPGYFASIVCRWSNRGGGCSFATDRDAAGLHSVVRSRQPAPS